MIKPDPNNTSTHQSNPIQSIPKIILKSKYSNLSNFLLFCMIPTSLLGIAIWPISLFFSFLPIFSLVSIPSFIFISIFLLFSISSIPYLLFAQTDPPEGSRILVLPLSPLRAWRVLRTIIQQSFEFSKLGLIELLLDYSYRRIIVIGGNKKINSKILKENISYRTTTTSTQSKSNRLDIYLPIDWSPISRSYPTQSSSIHLQSFDLSHSSDLEIHSDDSDSAQIPASALAPVIVFLHPGGWSITSKGLYIQLALRFRRLGFCVVVPNFTQFPEGRCEDSIADIRQALAWVQRSAHQYGGDGNRVYLLGHGSGAHLALLTVVQDAVIHSRDHAPSQAMIPSGLNRLTHSNDQYTTSNQIEGLILMSGIYDPIKQVRIEAKLGWEMVSTLRRALGPSHAQTLLNSPNHLLFASKDFLQVDRLPSKVLLIHGGRDTNVPIVQSVLCKTLLVGIGLKEVRLRAYRELGHLDSLLSIMIDGRRYGNLIDAEIVSLVTS
ncbi:lipase [Melampsora larici-populina 98AG31]|uniref:Lipase n=1 Tax=Melampsora larici-populina (strain 98AG31 / pathotype 3-4-7) TaxID=747676 RepID=F4RQ34_MELLP|nr:lipase [Melampsora larici-populina 98AG31]EGG05339.1 lipase [Melampsora larici-populina 98AG31]